MGYEKTCSRRLPGKGLRSRLGVALVLTVTASLSQAVPCHADGGLLIEAPSIAALPGTSGSFNVVLVNTGTQDQTIGGAALDLTLTGSAGNSILFTNATINTVSPSYIFAQSFDVNNGFTLYTNPLPDTNLMTFDTGDPINGYAGFTVLGPGDMYGLANVSYSVSPNAVLGTSDAISFVLANGATSLSDNNGNGVAAVTQDGLLSVVPEPSSLAQGTIAALIGLGLVLVSRVRSGAGRARVAR